MRHDGKKGCRYWAGLSVAVYAGGSLVLHVLEGSMVVWLDDKVMVYKKYLEMQDLVGQTVEILYANRRKVLSWRIDGRIGNRRADTAVRIVTRRVEMILQGGSVLYFLTGGYLF